MAHTMQKAFSMELALSFQYWQQFLVTGNLYARPRVEPFTNTTTSEAHVIPVSQRGTEAQRIEVTCPGHSE
jgi:hypothetical protein